MQKKLTKILTASSLILTLNSTVLAQDNMRILPFSDVGFAHKNYNAIKFLYEQEIINGYTDGTFKPENPINRVEALKIIFLSAKINPTAKDKLTYADVDIDAWYIPYLREALNKKIAIGYPDNTFKPANNINLVEALKMLIQAHNILPPPTDSTEYLYADTYLTEWYAPYIKYSKQNYLLSPDSNDKIHPSKDLTRGEFAEIVYRLIKPNYPTPITPTPTLPPITTTPITPTSPTQPAIGYEQYSLFESSNGKFTILYPKNYFYGQTKSTYQNLTIPKLVYEFSKTSLEQKNTPEYQANLRLYIYNKEEAQILKQTHLTNLEILKSKAIDDQNNTIDLNQINQTDLWPQAKLVLYRELPDGRLALIENLNTTESETLKTLSSLKTLNN